MMTSVPIFTRTDSIARDWDIDDEVIRLREWSTGSVHQLPEAPDDALTVGAAGTCSIRLNDPSGRVSRLHAHLVKDQTKWSIRDAGSKNGLRGDGVQRRELLLEPGVEIGIGGVTLVAESSRSFELRCFLARLLGWSESRTEVVDQALRSVRASAARRSALVLCGEGDLVPTARSIHRHSRGTDRPFVVCDPRRNTGKATVRSAENWSTGMAALAAAAGGTLCVRSQRLPPDFRDLTEALGSPTSRVQLVVCAASLEESELYRVMPIVIPPLASRGAEIDHVITEFADEAMLTLCTPRSLFLPIDRAWIREHASSSLPEIEKATLRLVALRASRNLSNAAARLGMAPVSLSRWIGRRRMPMEIIQ